MANIIKQKRGTSDPGASDLVVGELAINTTDGGVFTKTDGGTVVEVGSGGGGASEINDLSDAKTANSGEAIGLGTGTLAADDGTNSTIAIGKDALNDQTSGNFNCAAGVEALSKVTTNGQNAAFGVYAGRRGTGASNTFVGYSAGEGVSGSTTGGFCVGIGEKCMENYTTGTDHTAVGYRALRNVTSGLDNVSIGYQSGDAVTTGSNCVFLGHEAGTNFTTGSNVMALGHNAQPSSNTVSNEITLGDASVTKLRVPGVSFEVAGGQVTADAYTETVHALSGTDLDPANGAIQTVTLSANTTLTESLAAGESMLLMVEDGSSYAITWPTMEWIGGSAPTLGTSEYNAIELFKVGSTLYGVYIGEFSA